MKVKAIVFFAAMLIIALAFSVSSPASPRAAAKAVPAVTAQPAATAEPAPAEPHPEIREAIAALRRAKAHMEHAAHDFGGHRVEALKATDEAIHQLELALKFDKD